MYIYKYAVNGQLNEVTGDSMQELARYEHLMKEACAKNGLKYKLISVRGKMRG